VRAEAPAGAMTATARAVSNAAVRTIDARRFKGSPPSRTGVGGHSTSGRPPILSPAIPNGKAIGGYASGSERNQVGGRTAVRPAPPGPASRFCHSFRLPYGLRRRLPVPGLVRAIRPFVGQPHLTDRTGLLGGVGRGAAVVAPTADRSAGE